MRLCAYFFIPCLTLGCASVPQTFREQVSLGAPLYKENCARCHGLEAISGGIAPDLRKLDNDCVTLKVDARKKACVVEIDQYYASSVRKGKVTRRWCGSTPTRGASASGRSELRSGVLFMVRLGCRQRVAAS